MLWASEDNKDTNDIIEIAGPSSMPAQSITPGPSSLTSASTAQALKSPELHSWLIDDPWAVGHQITLNFSHSDN